MRIRVENEVYSKNAILVAVKKQQGFANWRIEECLKDSTVVVCSNIVESCSEDECEKRFRQQLDDEQIRERLEEKFGHIRNLLVNAALSPIINIKV
jgi:His-Xaa-Ser system protein HxsD